MRLITVGAAAALLLATPILAEAVTVRVYNNFGVSEEDLQVARAEAESILGDAGIEVTWMDCWVRHHEPVGAPAACRQVPGATDLVLRLQADRAMSRTKFVSMGFSLVNEAKDEGKETAFLSTVFVDVVWSVARGATSDPCTLLGQAIAHELGHLLLNTNSHARSGLMRAGWSRKEMRRPAASDGRFLDTEAAKMREAVEARRILAYGTERGIPRGSPDGPRAGR